LSQFLIVWASTVGELMAGKEEDDHRLYATTTRDFRSFAPTTLFYDPGFSVIDATFIRRGGSTIMFIKDEREEPLRKVIRWCEVSLSPRRFGPLSAPITPAWSEGPTAITNGGSTVVFFDLYQKNHYGAIASSDGAIWRDVSDRIAMPDGASHGTIIPISTHEFAVLASQH
jgi:hypothetical protein